MSGDRRDSTDANPNDRRLPPIREVLRDELDRPARPNPPRPPGQYAPWGHPGYSSRSEQRGGPALPPMQSRSTHTSSRAPADHRSSGAHGHYSSQQHSSRSQRDGHGDRDRPRATVDPGYSYGVLRTSGTSGEFVNAIPPSHQPQGILRQSAVPVRQEQEDLNKRYKCDYCGKRFGMPSHLQIHIRTHTAQRPFACEWPGCDRAFSVRSNMMRHFRSHGTSSVAQSPPMDEDEDEDAGGEEDARREASSSSHYFHRASSSGHQSTSGYYSSSRRK